MNLKAKLGSEKYPIRLTPHISDNKEYTRRFLNEEYIRFPHEGGTRLDFDKLPDVYIGGFVENVIGNPNLSGLEVKIALFLSQRAAETDLGILCRADESISNADLTKLIGEDDSLYHGYDMETVPYFLINDIIDLRAELSKLHINVTDEELSSVLYRLHDFSYITVTDICWDNIQKRTPQKPASLSKEELKQIYCRNIKVFPYMDTRAVYKYWKKANIS